jgi:hypothetical protein
MSATTIEQPMFNRRTVTRSLDRQNTNTLALRCQAITFVERPVRRSIFNDNNFDKIDARWQLVKKGSDECEQVLLFIVRRDNDAIFH